VHLLEVLSAPSKTDLLGHLRPLMALEPQTPIASALLSMRGGGRRMALVGSPDKPLGLVALKDLVEEITGDVVGL
jgi:CBS domain containing-hemolysin-like protein